ncbi:hypothetical protein LAZ67_22001459 [Cordylochernes scorpioides]|uniref:G-protein coupled receptors family 1 profile domain-containing protein n=1 Tax=Cordylochernes scorpioides TaxID=51811 RepID=A0ABY6LPD5_9ARAC|nr:hypothetical protein LAZ67_22001459 [Cordylochernes scorpioides]
MEALSWLLPVAGCIIIFIIIVGVSGNLLTLVALARVPRVRSAASAFIASLCVADLLFCAVNLPFTASRFLHRAWVHGDTLCVVFPFLRYVNVGMSLLSITAITVNRYILISHPRLYPRVYSRVNIVLMILFTWIFPVVLVFPTLFGKWGRFGYDPTILNCSILEVNGKSPKVFLFILGFLIPCVAILACYSRIFLVVRRSRLRVQQHGDRQGMTRQKKEEYRLTKMVLVIFCSFVCCYLPITIIKVVDKRAKLPALHLLGYIMIYASACVNPVIYGLTNKLYRNAYRTVLSCGRYREDVTQSGVAPRTSVSLVTCHSMGTGGDHARVDIKI